MCVKLQDPHVPPPAGVNHPGRRAQFTWSQDAVTQLLRVLAHTEARLVLTSKVPGFLEWVRLHAALPLTLDWCCVVPQWRNRATMRTSFNRELQKRGLPPLIGRTLVLEGHRARVSPFGFFCVVWLGL